MERVVVWRIIFVYDEEETRACGCKRNVKDVMLLSLFKARNILFVSKHVRYGC